jgi:flagellar motility protein MotE (MotC chaperone)
MNKQTYDNQAINAYLLGSLPADEAERFDELSFTDDEFAAQLQAAEKDLVDAYVRGEMPEKDLEQFKSYYLASPLRREKIKFAHAFQAFAEKNTPLQIAETQRDIIPAAGEKPERKTGGFFSNLFVVPRLSLQWGFAIASLFFVIFAGWLLTENSRLQNQTEEAQARQTELQRRESELQNEISNQRTASAEKTAELEQVRGEIARLEKDKEQIRSAENEREKRIVAEQKQPPSLANAPKQPPAQPNQIRIASFILTPQLRAASQIQTLSIARNVSSIDLRLELEPNDHPAFRVALKDQTGGTEIWRNGAMKAIGAGENRSINIRLPAKLLRSEQIYTVEVSGGDTDEIISNYSFRAVIK